MRFTSLLLSFLAALFVVTTVPVQTAHAATRLVLFEEATQWNCPPCALLNPQFEAFLRQNTSKAIAIRYHGWWPGTDNDPMYHFDLNDHQARINYYSIVNKGEPCTEIDGTYEHVGYASTFIASFGSEMNTRLSAPTPLALGVTETTSGNTVTVNVAANSSAALSGNYILRCAVVQNIVNDVSGGTNGETEWENVVRKMLPDANGTAFTINAGQNKTIQLTYNTADVPDPTNVFVVVWVQNESTKEVINAGTDAQDAIVTPRSAQLQVAAPNAINIFTGVAKNTTTVPTDFNVSLDPGTLPAGWEATFSVKGTTYDGPQVITVAPGDSIVANVSVKMTGGQGLATPVLTLAPSRHTSAVSGSMKFVSISNDVHTAIINADGGKGRQLVYESLLGDLHVVFGTVPSDLGSLLLQKDPSLTTIIYVAGQNIPSDAEITQLTTYMNGGGKLLMTGEVIGTEWVLGGSSTGQTFLSTMLHTALIKESGAFRGFTGVTDPSGIGTGITTGVRNSSYPDGMRYWPDAIRATDAKASVFGKFTGTDTACAMAITTTKYKAVFMTFPIEAMDNPAMQSLAMTRIWNWLNSSVQAAISITAPTTQTVWQQGTVQQITWSATGITTVKLSYSLDGSTYTPITSTYDATKGFFNWSLPSLAQAYTNCFVKIEDAATGSTVKTAGPFTISSPSAVHENAIATDFQIDQNYPNPFNASTLFSFTLPRSERVTLNIYDTKGAMVATVLDENRAAGPQSITFDAGSLAAGVYEYRMITPTGNISHMMTLVKK